MQHGMRDNSENDTFLTLKGMDLDEILEFVSDIDLTGMNLAEVADKMNPVLIKHGWSIMKIIEAQIDRQI